MTAAASALQVLLREFSSADDFLSVPNFDVDFTPLTLNISAAYTFLALPGCDVSMIQSFPRIMNASVRQPDCTLIGFLMDEGVPLNFNGVESNKPIIVTGRSGSEYSVVERTSRQLAVILFRPEVEGRGWPAPKSVAGMFETSLMAYRRLQRLMSEIISVARTAPDQLVPNASPLAVKESLLAAVDAAFADAIDSRWIDRAQMVRQYKILKAIESAIADDLGRPIYSEELAQRVGVSVRTLHSVVQHYRGMSLHQYLRLRRLWLVRKQLLAGEASVKGAALTFGFWHLGDFARSYRLQFGELPSDTLARAR
jgi:AraC family ethanolamine operon transcriptional activator